jgi:hypothetical protein
MYELKIRWRSICTPTRYLSHAWGVTEQNSRAECDGVESIRELSPVVCRRGRFKNQRRSFRRNRNKKRADVRSVRKKEEKKRYHIPHLISHVIPNRSKGGNLKTKTIRLKERQISRASKYFCIIIKCRPDQTGPDQQPLYRDGGPSEGRSDRIHRV